MENGMASCARRFGRSGFGKCLSQRRALLTDQPGRELDALAVSAIVLGYLITSTRSRQFVHDRTGSNLTGPGSCGRQAQPHPDWVGQLFLSRTGQQSLWQWTITLAKGYVSGCAPSTRWQGGHLSDSRRHTCTTCWASSALVPGRVSFPWATSWPFLREPDAANPHVRFDERGVKTEARYGFQGTPWLKEFVTQPWVQWERVGNPAVWLGA